MHEACYNLWTSQRKTCDKFEQDVYCNNFKRKKSWGRDRRNTDDTTLVIPGIVIIACMKNSQTLSYQQSGR